MGRHGEVCGGTGRYEEVCGELWVGLREDDVEGGAVDRLLLVGLGGVERGRPLQHVLLGRRDAGEI